MTVTNKFCCLLLLATSFLVYPVCSWSELGHRTVGYLAQMYLTPNAATYTANLLQNEDISEAALWADELKFHFCGGWGYTRELHFIDAKDDPPNTCEVKYDRDCDRKKGCVVSAIVNYTSRVNDQSLSIAQQQYALRFLLHFIGDVHQPLHDEAEDRGGNGISVHFDHRKTELHAVWDKSIPEKHAGTGDDVADAKAWAEKLFNSNSQTLDDECHDLSQAQECALLWANEANSHICSYVLKDGVDGVQDVDLGGDYYEGAVPIVDDLIGKAGLRLGTWLNGLAEQATSLGLVDQSVKHELLRRSGKHPKKPSEPFECPDPNA